MATFKVGQRVRITDISNRDLCPNFAADVIGRHGVIEEERPSGDYFNRWVVRYYGPPARDANEFGPNRAAFRSCDLAPLTDPKADEFIESLKKLKPYEEPVVAAQDRFLKRIAESLR